MNSRVNQVATTNLNTNIQDNLLGAEFEAKGTGYYPADTALQGGRRDEKGKPLNTLQAFLEGKAPYVSVAIDKKLRGSLPYGSVLQIKQLEEKYGKPIEFRVVDNGGAFNGKGLSKIDICTANSTAAHDSVINQQLNVVVVSKPSPNGGTLLASNTPPSQTPTRVSKVDQALFTQPNQFNPSGPFRLTPLLSHDPFFSRPN